MVLKKEITKTGGYSVKKNQFEWHLHRGMPRTVDHDLMLHFWIAGRNRWIVYNRNQGFCYDSSQIPAEW